MTTPMPLARTAELIIQEIDHECLVYDLSTNKALSLNEVSAEIWKHCDGKTTVEDVRAVIEAKSKAKIDEDFIWLAINDLEKNNLLDGEVKRPAEFDNLSRRKVLLKYALPAMAIPVIFSIVAPSPVMAQTGGGTGGTIPLGGACPTGMGCVTGLLCLSSGGVLTCCAAGTNPVQANTPGSVVGGCISNGACMTSSLSFCCSGMTAFTPNPVCANPGEGRCDCV